MSSRAKGFRFHRTLFPQFREHPKLQVTGLSILYATIFDHIDLRVRDLVEAKPFYDVILPALGFSHEAHIEGWVQYEVAGTDGTPEFFGLTVSPQHVPNEGRMAFWADSHAEVDRLAAAAVLAGARNVEGPLYEEPGYYAVFFDEPSGNRLEICCREPAESRPADSGSQHDGGE